MSGRRWQAAGRWGWAPPTDDGGRRRGDARAAGRGAQVCTTTRRRCRGAGRNGTERAVSLWTSPCLPLFFIVWWARPRSRRANGRPGSVTRTATRDATASGWASARLGRCTGGPRPHRGGWSLGCALGGLPPARRCLPLRAQRVEQVGITRLLATLPRDARGRCAPRSFPCLGHVRLFCFVDWAVGARVVPLHASPRPRRRQSTAARATRGCPGDPRRVPLPREPPPLARGDTPTRPQHVTQFWSGASRGLTAPPPHTGAAPHGPPVSGALPQCQNACTAAWWPHRLLRGRGRPCATGGRGVPPLCPAGGADHTPGRCQASPHGDQPGRLADGRRAGHVKRGQTQRRKKWTVRRVFRGAGATANETKKVTASGALRSGAAAREERKENSTHQDGR